MHGAGGTALHGALRHLFRSRSLLLCAAVRQDPLLRKLPLDPPAGWGNIMRQEEEEGREGGVDLRLGEAELASLLDRDHVFKDDIASGADAGGCGRWCVSGRRARSAPASCDGRRSWRGGGGSLRRMLSCSATLRTGAAKAR